MKCTLICLLMVLLKASAFGQTIEPINTDRPDQSDGTYILTTRSLQIETGFIFSQSDHRLTDIMHTTMIRYGVSKKLEVRVLVNEGFNSMDAFKTFEFALDPVAISAKRALCPQNGLFPAITAVGYLKIPFAASKNNQVSYYAPTFLLAFQNDFKKRLSLGYNAGITWDGTEKQNSWLATASFSYSVSDKSSFFAEYFSLFNTLHAPSNNIDFGAQYLLKPQLQVDLAAGESLFSKSRSVFETLGISYRF